MSNIKNIAKLAKVSTTTVSRVLNGHPYVSQEKREAVWNVISRMDYTPNNAAVRLKSGKTQMIAILVPYINHDYFSQVIEGIGEMVLSEGYSYILCQVGLDKSKEIAYLEMLKKKQVDGIILTTLFNSWEVIEEYTRYGPIVSCGEYSPEITMPTVYVDHYEGASFAMKHLIDRGYRNIGFVICGKDNIVSRDRKSAYEHYLERYSLVKNEKWVFDLSGDQLLDGQDLFNQIREMKDQPDALFVANGDQVAAGLYIEARKNGWDIPGELAIVGIDDQPISALLEITTVHQPIKRMGNQSAVLLFDILNGNPPEQLTHSFPFKLITRKTS